MTTDLGSMYCTPIVRMRIPILIFALAAFGVSFVTGAFLLGPESGRLSRMQRARGPEDPELQARVRMVLRIARVDQLILLLIVFDMVAKPFL